MFTGLIEKTGTIKNFNLTSEGGVVEIICNFPNKQTIKLGNSIAVNGVCLTVSEINNNFYSFDVMNETINISNLKYLKSGDIVNLERAMQADGRFNGHVVQGHIDCIAKVKNILNDGFSRKIEFLCNTDLIILKGSIAVNGVSLTVSEVSREGFEVSLIPSTIKETNLKDLKTGDIVNIEYDITGKYIKKFMENMNLDEKKSKITEEFLKENGF